MPLKFIWRGVLGNIASSIWFFMFFSKLLHALRGVKFEDRASVFMSNVLLDNKYPELISIGADVWLTQGVTILTHSYCSEYQTKNFAMTESIGPVTIGSGVFIGVNAIVLPNVTLGEGCYIAAGSVVNKSIRPGYLAAGVPCKEIRRLGCDL